MKKKILFLIVLFMMLIGNVKAEGVNVNETILCNYNNGNEILSVEYLFTNEAQVREIKLYDKSNNLFYYNSADDIDYLDIDQSIIVYNIEAYKNFYKNVLPVSSGSTMVIAKNHIQSKFNELTRKDLSDDEKRDLICPNQMYVTSNNSESNLEEKYEFYACGYDEDTQDSCNLTNIYLNDNNNNNYSILNYQRAKTTYLKVDVTDFDDNNYQEQWQETQEDINSYCTEEYIAEHGELDCNMAKNSQDTVETKASDINFSINYNLNYNFDFEEGDSACDSLLGKINDKNDPAYYINFVFNLIKYVAIVLLFVFSIIEIVKAVVSSDNDALKKAIQKTVKRLVICIIIFFLPRLLNFIFELIGWYTDPTCGIGVGN